MKKILSFFIIILFCLTLVSASSQTLKVSEDPIQTALNKIFSSFNLGSLADTYVTGKCSVSSTRTDYPIADEVYVRYAKADEEIHSVLYYVEDWDPGLFSKSDTTPHRWDCESLPASSWINIYDERTISPGSDFTLSFPSTTTNCYKLVQTLYTCEMPGVNTHLTQNYFCDNSKKQWYALSREASDVDSRYGHYCDDASDNAYKDYQGVWHCASSPSSSWCVDLSINKDSTACYDQGGRVLSSCDVDIYTETLWKIEEGASAGLYCCSFGLAEDGSVSGWASDFSTFAGNQAGEIAKGVGGFTGDVAGGFASGLTSSLGWVFWVVVVFIVILIIIVILKFVLRLF